MSTIISTLGSNKIEFNGIKVQQIDYEDGDKYFFIMNICDYFAIG